MTKRGSPPRVRELQNANEYALIWGRITPACAGITMHVTSGIFLTKDHPRVCGNYRFC